MKSIAAIHRTYGNPAEVVHPETIEIPEPKKGEAVVKLVKAVVNPSDLGMIGGSYGRLRQLPAIAGREGVGEVVALGPRHRIPAHRTLVRLPSEPGAWTNTRLQKQTIFFKFRPASTPTPPQWLSSIPRQPFAF